MVNAVPTEGIVPALTALNLRVSGGNGGPLILEEVNLHVSRGERVCLLGPNGCGKTTLIRVLGGVLAPTHGFVTIDGEPLGEARRKGKVGVAFQSPAVFPWRTVYENVVLPAQVLGRTVDKTAIRLELAAVGLEPFEEFAGRYPDRLSGGERQRLALATLSAMRPAYVLLDEPFAAIDAITREELQELILLKWSGPDTSVVLVTHDVNEAVFIGQRILFMSPTPARIVREMTVDYAGNRDAAYRASTAYVDAVATARATLQEIARPRGRRLAGDT